MYTRQDYVDHKCTHSEYFRQFVNSMQKRMILSRWTAEELAKAWENDEAFNTQFTPIREWDKILCPVDPRLLDAVGESSTPPTRTCILKEAARQIVMEHYETCGRVYDQFKYKILYLRDDPGHYERCTMDVIATDKEHAQRLFEKAHPAFQFLSATKYSKHNAVKDRWEHLTDL